MSTTLHYIIITIMNKKLPQWCKLSNYAFKLSMEQQPFPKTFIGFDIGLKSTGVSVTSFDLRHAFYLTTLTGELRSKQILEKATSLLLKEKPVGIVIGRPNYVVQSQSESIIEAIDDWIREMAQEHPKTGTMQYTLVDESWTTLEAGRQLQAIENQVKCWGHLRKQKELVDGMAAINILRSYLQFYNKH